jgi:hypothetical protein
MLLVRLAQPLAVVAAAALASCGGEEDPGDSSKDSRPTAAIDTVADGCRAVPELRQRQVLLACEPFSRARELQVRTERDSGGRDGCLEIYGMGDGQSRACGYVPYKRDPVPSSPITLDSVNQLHEASPVEIYGSAATEVEGVTISYTDRTGRSGRTTATLLRVADAQALEAARLERPFRYFVAELPPDSVEASATATAANGRPLTTIDLAIAIYRPPFVYGRE